MTCRELTDFIMDYLDGALSPAQRLELERHLAVCPSCVEYLRSYKRVTELSGEAFDEADPAVLPPVPDELVKAILAAQAKGR